MAARCTVNLGSRGVALSFYRGLVGESSFGSMLKQLHNTQQLTFSGACHE
jgi:hypothetical protein